MSPPPSDTAPKRGGFRPGEDLAPGEFVAPEAPVLSFTPAANAGGTDHDVLMGYQLFLGRDPENSFVIADAKSSPVGAFIRALMGSGEFQSVVLDRLEAGRPLPHEATEIAPSQMQLDWLFRHVSVPSYAEIMLRSAPTWGHWLRVLLAVPGVPKPPVRSGGAPSGVSAVEAGEGFVLIHLEQPKPGEAFHPGSLVSGSGWAIAPADVVEVAVLLDDAVLTHARYGLPRPDIARNFPHYRHVDHCGFAFTVEIPETAKLTETSQLIVRVRTQRGEEGRRGIRLLPPIATHVGKMSVSQEAWPIRLSVDEALVDDRRVLRLRGWAAARTGPTKVAVALGDVDLGHAKTGLSRPDIAQSYPEYADAAQAGFAVVHPLSPDTKAGPSFVRVEAQDQEGNTRQTILPISIPPIKRTNAAPRPVTAQATAKGPSAAPDPADMRLELDRPLLDGDTVQTPLRGALTLSGWAVARAGMQGVAVFCDGAPLGNGHLGMRREDIGGAFSDYPGSLLAGFALVVPPGQIPPGRHEIKVVASANDGSTTEQHFFLTAEREDALPPEAALRTRMPPAEAALGLRLLEERGFRPAFEIVIGAGPAGNDDVSALAATLQSLSAQLYTRWTARIFLSQALQAAAHALPEAVDPAGRIVFGAIGSKPAVGGRAKPTRDANAPHWLVKLRPGDRLGCDALLELALAAADGDDLGFLYSDELRIAPAERHVQPFFKPDWSPDLLLSMNYVGRLWCASAALVDAAGFTAAALAGASDYDAVLRLTEQDVRIGHVARVLCARGDQADSAADERSALTAALARRGITARLEPGALAGTWRVRRDLPKPRRAAREKPSALVSIVIPTCGAGGLVREAIKSIRATTFPARPAGLSVQIVVLDNTPPADKQSRAWLRKNADVVIDMPDPFNWSRFNNAGAAASSGEYLLFLNDDIEVSQPDWLEAMVEQAQRRDVGVVGARLLYPDGKVQHAGQYLADGHARHAFRFTDGTSPGPFGLATVAREVMAVTGACQLMHRRVFSQLGGFEEAHSVVNNDLDFCLRCWQAGLKVIYTPHATLVHHELASRAELEDSFDETRFSTAWRQRFLAGDPFRNPHLGADSDDYGAEPEPAMLLHAGRRGPLAEDVHKILAIKLDHIGDFLTALPALRCLREQFPRATIDLLVPSATAALAGAEGDMPFDRTIVFDFFHARSGEGQKGVGEDEFLALQERLAPHGYDMAIDLRMHPETRMALRYSGAPFLAGYDHNGRFPWLDVALEWEGDTRLASKRAHVSERLVQLVSAVVDACRPASPAPVRAKKARRGKIPALAALPSSFLAKPIVCIHPGVGNVVRQWPPAAYSALIDLLAAKSGVHAVLIGSAEEAPIAEEIMRRVADPGVVESLVGKVKLAELPALMQACVLFVGNNSGPQHIAASLGIPALGIHSGVVDAAEWAPLGSHAMAIRRRMVCSPCYLEFAADCPRDLACLNGLLPRDVYQACRRLLI